MVIIAHNIRSAHNVGSLLRTAEGLGMEKVYLTGYTPYPKMPNDSRLPHIAEKVSKSINKTALGSENFINWEYVEDIDNVLQELKHNNFTLAGLEQNPGNIKLQEFDPPEKMALLLGSEVTGIDEILIKKMDLTLEIPMRGKKESFNVVEAATMAMYHCTF